MKTLIAAILVVGLWSGAARATVPAPINEQGASGAPVSAQACSGGATEMFPSSNTTTSWAMMPEGGDVRCELRALPDAAATPVPTATVGFLFKSNILVNESTLNIGSTTVRLGLDCCGVSGSVPVDTWRE